MKRQKTLRLHPVERALAKARWNSLMTEAQLHASWGDDFDKVVDKLSTLLYIAGLAAHTAKLDLPEVRIIHGACRTTLDCVCDEKLAPLQRQTLLAGLEAAARLKPLLPEEEFIKASIHAATLIKNGGVFWRDFQVFLISTR